MVVDDKPANLRLLEKMLSEKGYRVRIFPKGEMALASARKDPPDLILLDINMPELDGYEVCRRLKAEERTENLPVIFISAFSETTEKVKAFDLGGVDYITKPFHVEEVYARISLHLELRRAKSAVEEKNLMLRQALDDLKAAQQQLIQSEKMAALGILTAGIAHEINNPVNFIKTSVLGLSRDIEDMNALLHAYDVCADNCRDTRIQTCLQEAREAYDHETLITEIPQLVANIHQGVSRTEEIVNSLRSYSRSDRMETASADLHGLINAALTILENRYKHHIDVVRKFASLPALSVHPSKLIQALINILSNAIDAIENRSTLKKGVITIETSVQTRKDLSYAVVAVADNGSGIPEEIQKKIFDPFFTTKDVGKGMGLGLSITLGIIEEHQGQIEVNTNAESGTTFSILLPLKPADEHDGRQEAR